MTRRLSGVAILPDDAPTRTARAMRVEVRDETLADGPAPLLAAARFGEVACRPGARVPFALDAPAAAPTDSLGLRVHVAMAGGAGVEPGDLLSATAVPIPAEGDAVLAVPLELVTG